jgi:hypothetical protein
MVLVEQKLLTFPEHLSSSLVLSGVRVNRFLVLCVPFVDCIIYMLKEEFEDTKGVIRIRKSKDRQHNGQKEKRTNNDLQSIHIKLKIEFPRINTLWYLQHG